MKTPFKTILVYDLETGGFKEDFNSITEMAIVAVDATTLEIIDEFSVMISPYVNLKNMYLKEDASKEAKAIYKNLSIKEDDGNKYMEFEGQKLTVMTCVDALAERIAAFNEFININYQSRFLKLADIVALLQNKEHAPIMRLYFNNAYNPQALEATKISTKMLTDEGVDFHEAYEQINEKINSHKVGNSKPVVAGHNIGSLPRRIVKGKEVKPDGFDNPFMEVFYALNDNDWFYTINDEIIDTLKLARWKWAELSAYNLGTCANELGLTLEEAHRALPDTIANARVLIKMLKALRGEGSGASTYKRKTFDLNY